MLLRNGSTLMEGFGLRPIFTQFLIREMHLHSMNVQCMLPGHVKSAFISYLLTF